MKSFSIKLLTNLKVSGSLTVPAGQIFSGPLEELPDYIQTMYNEGSRSIVVRELPDPVIVPEIPAKDELLNIYDPPAKEEVPELPAKEEIPELKKVLRKSRVSRKTGK